MTDTLMKLDIQVTPCDTPDCPYPNLRVTAEDTGIVLIDHCLTALSMSPLLASCIAEPAAEVLTKHYVPAIAKDYILRRSGAALTDELEKD